MRATQQGLLKLTLRAGRGRMDLSTRTTSAKAFLQRMPRGRADFRIVTTYNCEDALKAVRRSRARQTDGDFELVVGDDGSKTGHGRAGRGLESQIEV